MGNEVVDVRTSIPASLIVSTTSGTMSSGPATFAAWDLVYIAPQDRRSGEGEIQPTVLGEGGKPMTSTPNRWRRSPSRAPASPSVSDASRLRTGRIRRAAFSLKAGDVFAGNHHAAADLTARDEVLQNERPRSARRRTRSRGPVHRLWRRSPADVKAQRRSKDLRGSAVERLMPRDQHLDVGRLMLRWERQSRAAPAARRKVVRPGRCRRGVRGRLSGAPVGFGAGGGPG